MRNAPTGEEVSGHYVAAIVPTCQLGEYRFNAEGATSQRSTEDNAEHLQTIDTRCSIGQSWNRYGTVMAIHSMKSLWTHVCTEITRIPTEIAECTQFQVFKMHVERTIALLDIASKASDCLRDTAG
jgi:hypothetical protein